MSTIYRCQISAMEFHVFVIKYALLALYYMAHQLMAFKLDKVFSYACVIVGCPAK